MIAAVMCPFASALWPQVEKLPLMQPAPVDKTVILQGSEYLEQGMAVARRAVPQWPREIRGPGAWG